MELHNRAVSLRPASGEIELDTQPSIIRESQLIFRIIIYKINCSMLKHLFYIYIAKTGYIET